MTLDFVLVLALKQIDTVQYKGITKVILELSFHFHSFPSQCIYRILHMRIIYNVQVCIYRYMYIYICMYVYIYIICQYVHMLYNNAFIVPYLPFNHFTAGFAVTWYLSQQPALQAPQAGATAGPCCGTVEPAPCGPTLWQKKRTVETWGFRRFFEVSEVSLLNAP